jgi:hypothetical protein
MHTNDDDNNNNFDSTTNDNNCITNDNDCSTDHDHHHHNRCTVTWLLSVRGSWRRLLFSKRAKQRSMFCWLQQR